MDKQPQKPTPKSTPQQSKLVVPRTGDKGYYFGMVTRRLLVRSHKLSRASSHLHHQQNEASS